MLVDYGLASVAFDGTFRKGFTRLYATLSVMTSGLLLTNDDIVSTFYSFADMCLTADWYEHLQPRHQRLSKAEWLSQFPPCLISMIQPIYEELEPCIEKSKTRPFGGGPITDFPF